MQRIKRISRTTAALVGVSTAIGLAWLVAGLIEGTLVTHTGKAKKVNITLAVTASPTEGLVPWGQEGGPTGSHEDEQQTLSASFTNTNSVFSIEGFNVAVTDSNEPECAASNFRIVGGESVEGSGYGSAVLTYSKPLKTVAHGEVQNLPSIAILQLRPTSGEAPIACEGVETKVHVVAVSKG